MMSNNVTINSLVGLRARNAHYFVQKANEYNSSIYVQAGDRNVNAKSILGILSLNVHADDTVHISANGKDEDEAIEGLTQFIKNGFKEIEEEN